MQLPYLFIFSKALTATLYASLFLVSACTHTGPPSVESISKEDWKYDYIKYRHTLAENHPDSAEKVLAISEQVRNEIQNLFGHLSQKQTAYALANWVISKKGLALSYKVDATLTPLQTYQQRQGNCLSYSLLLTQLGKALGVKIHMNSVDIPDTWSMQDDTLSFYRHVNVVYKTLGDSHVFDFTPGASDARYPQKLLDEQQALALFFNNRALDHLRLNDHEQATHYIKLATSLSSDNPDIWTNAGAILKRKKSTLRAKEALLFALTLDSGHVVAASQLERLYREEGDTENAEKYLNLATKARFNNPYYLFREAKKRFLDQDYDQAEELAKSAISKHRYDPRFFALLGVTQGKLENHKAARRSFKKASALELNLEQKQRYENKAMLISKRSKNPARSQPPVKYQVDIESL